MRLGELVGVGNTASVYKWGKGKVIKLFHIGYPNDAVNKEFNNALVINNFSFTKPKVYEVTEYNHRHGIIYEYVEGESLHDWVIKTNNVEQCALYMVELHKGILKNKVNNIPSYKVFLKDNIIKAKGITFYVREKALNLLRVLPEGNSLCHGDFHPGNIFLTKNGTMAIDFMNICKGSYLYDVARSVYLMQYTPIPAKVVNKDMFLKLKKDITDLYLTKMNIEKDDIKVFLEVITVARKGECPEEF